MNWLTHYYLLDGSKKIATLFAFDKPNVVFDVLSLSAKEMSNLLYLMLLLLLFVNVSFVIVNVIVIVIC